VCAELGAGRATLVLRKGGIAEKSRRGFTAAHREFFLFPSHFHERPEDLRHVAAPNRVAAAVPRQALVELSLHAAVAELAEITDLEVARALVPHQSLTLEAIERRFRYRKPGIAALVLRVHHLATPLAIPNLARYDVCRSWVELPQYLVFERAEPVLDDATFGARLNEIRAVLGTG